MNPLLKRLLHLRNTIDFPLRSLLSFSTPYSGRTEDKSTLFNSLCSTRKKSAEAREVGMRTRYSLDALYENSINHEYLQNLTTLEFLEQGITNTSAAPKIKLLDIGSKYFCYAPAIHAFFSVRHPGKPVQLTGIEVDAYRRFIDLHTRYDYAQYYIRTIPAARYIAGDFLKHEGEYDFITWFYPFIFDYAHLVWGLPLNLLKPREMLAHAYSLLAPGGTLLIINQYHQEKAVQAELCAQMLIGPTSQEAIQSSFTDSQVVRYSTVIKKAY